ncbi:MAG: 6-hydroxymethylpterin diphosphokinase MptE-like protein [Candidatus Thorarchaeota archaeon]|jgi:uncharacterized Rossmann fold enzyme
MDWKDWKPFYDEIIVKLGINSLEDYKATRILSQLITEIRPAPLIARLEKAVNGRDVVVFGGGPSLENHIEYIMKDSVFDNAIFVAADGATSALLEKDAKCDVIVTDLDGDMSDILYAVNEGTLAIVHAHGDNIPLVTEFVPEMNALLGSTQVEPLSNVFLWGGFTDGDRACHIVSHYSPKRIILAGMDFGETIGRWSKPGHTSSFSASPRKRIKLDIAQMLLDRLWDVSGIPHLSLSSS